MSTLSESARKAVKKAGKVAGSIQQKLFSNEQSNKVHPIEKETASTSSSNTQRKTTRNVTPIKSTKSATEVEVIEITNSNENDDVSNGEPASKDDDEVKSTEQGNDTESQSSDTVNEQNRISQRLKQFRFEKDIIEDDDVNDNNSNTSQDNDDTVGSNNTSKRSKKNDSKLTLPPFTRYQLMILLDQENRDSPVDEDEGEEKSPAQRLRDVLVSLATQIKIFDSEAKVISWKTSPNFCYMNMDDFPTEVPQIAMFFNGYRANVKADKRVYLRVGIHTPNSQSALHSFLNSWICS